MTVAIEQDTISHLLGHLLGRSVDASAAPVVQPHPATCRGLVSDEDKLVAVIGSDLAFAHNAGAALAMLPPARLDDLAGAPDTEILAIYTEVANVLSRLVNEAAPGRVRLDPSLEHPDEALQRVIATGEPIMSSSVSIAGYGPGQLAVWYNRRS
jgi:hypothetical protein